MISRVSLLTRRAYAGLFVSSRTQPVFPARCLTPPTSRAKSDQPDHMTARTPASQATAKDAGITELQGSLNIPGAAQQPPRLAKRKVAVFVAYVGSAFRGLQIQRDQPGGTVEDVLQEALNAAGCILHSNYGSLQKIGWSRSSRTDKGVHALANVVAMKLECDPESFKTDPEGCQLASAINQHLPSEVRVLSVQRVNAGFNARGYCNTRTYHYYLPASILGLALDGGAEDQARMDLLRRCCSLYEGNRPFHNYTKRRLYRTPAPEPPPGMSQSQVSHSDPSSSPSQAQLQGLKLGPHASNGDDAVTSSERSDSSDWEVVQHPETDGISEDVQASPRIAESQDAAEKPPFWSTPRPLQYRWLDEMDPRDRLAPAHYRYINSFCADDAAPLGNGGISAVKVSITGASFMLHQIRHMVGAAVAVARGDLPLDYVSASLCAPARAVLPLAPAQVLVLAGSAFQPFPSDQKNGMGTIQSLSGTTLELKSSGQATRDLFAQQELYPAIQSLIQNEVWAKWENDLKMTTWQDDDLAAFVRKSEQWRVQRAEIAKEKQAKLSSAEQK